jgi:hypothetical protein
MAKARLADIAKELGGEPDFIARLAAAKLPKEMIGGGKGLHMWIERDGIPILKEALFVPEFTPKFYYGRVKRTAPNPRFVYVHVEELGKVVPTLIPRQMQGRMQGKRVRIEEIEDVRGKSYRWVRE